MNERHAKGETFGSVSTNFVEGFRRVVRPKQTRLMNEAQRRAMQVRESRVAAAAEFFTDLLSGQTPYYFLKEMLRPSAPQMERMIEGAYPGLYRPMTLAERHYATAIYGDESLLESQTTSDFPLLMGDVLDRMLLQRYAEVPQVWRQYIGVGRPLRDFRLARMLQTDGGDGQWNTITEEDGLNYTSITESGHTITAALYGKGIRLAWRLLMNDDLDAFAEVPGILGRGGRRTISKFATGLLFDSSGPDATHISAGNGNLITGNPDLAIDSLGTAIQQIAGFTDTEGEPILTEGMILVHGPGLRVTVQNLLNQLSVDVTSVGGVSGQTVRVNNWIVQGLTAVEDPYIPIVATSNGDTSWLLAASPQANRPAAQVRFLAGFEEPQLYQKAPNTMAAAGGVNASLGDFDSMASEYKGLVAFGGTVIEPKSVVGSNGSNA